MANGGLGIFAEKAAHPLDAFPHHDVVGIDHGFEGRDGSDMAANHDHGAWRQRARDLAHLLHLADVGRDG